MSMPFERAVSAVMALLPAIVTNLSSQADTEAASGLPPASNTTRALPRADGAADRETRDFLLSATYDRTANRTRLTVIPAQKDQASMDRASISFSVSVTYPGRAPSVTPDSADFLFTAWAPARSGWALAHPGTLKLTLDDSLPVAIPSTTYHRLPVRLTARGRTELIVCRVATTDLLALAASTKSKLQVGRFTIKLDAHAREGLQAFARRLMPAAP